MSVMAMLQHLPNRGIIARLSGGSPWLTACSKLWFAKMPSAARTLRISNIPGQGELCSGTFRWACNNVTFHEIGSDGIFADHSSLCLICSRRDPLLIVELKTVS